MNNLIFLGPNQHLRNKPSETRTSRKFLRDVREVLHSNSKGEYYHVYLRNVP